MDVKHHVYLLTIPQVISVLHPSFFAPLPPRYIRVCVCVRAPNAICVCIIFEVLRLDRALQICCKFYAEKNRSMASKPCIINPSPLFLQAAALQICVCCCPFCSATFCRALRLQPDCQWYLSIVLSPRIEGTPVVAAWSVAQRLSRGSELP